MTGKKRGKEKKRIMMEGQSFCVLSRFCAKPYESPKELIFSHQVIEFTVDDALLSFFINRICFSYFTHTLYPRAK